MDPLLAFDGTADADIFVFERHGTGWRHIPSPAPAAYEPPPVTVTWSEIGWIETVEGWARQYAAEGGFTLTAEQRDLMIASYRQAIADGKLWVSSTADDVDQHIRRARL